MGVEQFVATWTGVSGSERANYQIFVGELCALLDVPRPDPSREDTRDNAYVFERRVTFSHGDGSTSSGTIAGHETPLAHRLARPDQGGF